MRILLHCIPEREESIVKIMTSHAHCAPDVELFIYTDKQHEGNLPAYLKSIDFISDPDHGVADNELIWHLQDDAFLLPGFWDDIKRRSKMYDDSIRMNGPFYIFCGFTSEADKIEGRGNEYKPVGEVKANDMFYSFPCIGIPLWISKDFRDYIKDGSELTQMEKSWVNTKKYDDSLFQNFLKKRNFERDVLRIVNLPKCLVDHRDDLCGGSVVNPNAASDGRRARLK